jgi:hypothetical protein
MSMDTAKLLAFEDRVKRADPKDAALFVSLLNEGMQLLSLLHKDLAEELAMARPTVTRWTNGTVTPHPAMRKATYGLLMKRSGAVRRSRDRVAVTA